jgi:hypothetical protein
LSLDDENNNKDSKNIIKLKQSEALKQNGLVIDSVYYTNTNDVKISLNHAINSDIIFTIDKKKWQNNLNTIVEQAEDNGIFDKELKQLLIRHLNDNHDEILTAAATAFSKNNNTTNITNDEGFHDSNSENDKPKHEIPIYKYSQNGKGELHEAVIVNGLPFFVKYDHTTNTFELIEKIEENSRILRPPQREEYPYIPYEFESNEDLAFFMQKASQITLDELYKINKNIFLIFVDQDKHIITLLTADSIWTYFQDLFSVTHYSEGIGTNDVGKSSIGYTFEYTGYRVIKATAISGANYYRVLGSIEPGQCVIVEDEGDSISEDSDKVKILKSGYEYGGRVPKINMNTINQGQNWWKTFCYKMILAEKSLKEYKAPGLVDRTFSFPCRPGKVKYSIKEVVSENINKSPRLQRLYDQLLSFRKLMLCYRLVHYKDLLTEIETGLKNRDNELCKPLLQLFYGTKALEEIKDTLEEFIKKRRTRKGNSLEAALYPIIKKNVFSEVGLNSSTNTYSELKVKKTLIKVPFVHIWNDIIGKDVYKAEIEGRFDEDENENKNKNKYAYETIDYGTLYLNSLPTFIHNKFTAEVKKQSYGKALVFDIEKLEKFEDLYSDSQLKEENVKIEVKEYYVSKIISDDYDNYDDFLGVYAHISEEKSSTNSSTQGKNGNSD